MAIDRLTALDQLMLAAGRRWPQDIGALAILDGEPLLDETGTVRIEAVRAAIGSRLHLVPRFRQVIRVPGRGLGSPYWVDAAAFDLAHHVRELRLEPPVGETALLLAVEQIRRQPLDPSRPLWEMWLLSGLPGRRLGLFVRLHHSIADGMAAMGTIAAFLDPEPLRLAPVVPPPWEPRPAPSERRLLADVRRRRAAALSGWARALMRPTATLGRVSAAWPAVRELLAEEPATRTSLDRMVGPARRVALVRTSLDAVRDVGRPHGATVNDVLLAATSAGLRQLLASRGEPVEATTIRIYVPVSLRRHRQGVQQGNLIAEMAVPLRLGETDPGRRLRQVADETTTRKARARTSLGTLMATGTIGRRLMLLAVMRQRVNATSASIPGPVEPLYLAGARVLEVFPVLPLIANEPLGVGAVSYAGALEIGIAADADALPDLEVFAAGMCEELQALGVPTFEGSLEEIAPAADLVGVSVAAVEGQGVRT